MTMGGSDDKPLFVLAYDALMFEFSREGNQLCWCGARFDKKSETFSPHIKPCTIGDAIDRLKPHIDALNRGELVVRDVWISLHIPVSERNQGYNPDIAYLYEPSRHAMQDRQVTHTHVLVKSVTPAVQETKSV